MSRFGCNFYWAQSKTYISLDGREGTTVPSVSYSYGTWYNAYSIVDGTHVTLKLDSTTVWSGDTSGYYGGLSASSHVGISLHQGTDMRFDDYEVTSELYPVIARAGQTVPPQFATVGKAFEYTPPASLFDHRDSTGVSFSATLEDGSPLPAWLSVAAANGKLSGTPTGESLGIVSITLKAAGANFGCATVPISLSVYGADCSFLDAVSSPSAGVSLLLDFVEHSPNTAGVNLAVVRPVEDDQYTFVSAAAFAMPSQEAALGAFIAGVADGDMVLVGTTGGATSAVSSGTLAPLGITAFPTAQRLVAIGRKGALLGTVPQRTAFVGTDISLRSLAACHVSSRTMAENEAEGTPVGAVVRTNAPHLTFPLGSMEAAEDANGDYTFFSTHPRTGVLSVLRPISFEAHPLLQVQVLVREAGWRALPIELAAQAGAESFAQIPHSLDTFPTRVKVLVESSDFTEPNHGFFFEAIGAAARDGSHPTEQYGGVVYAWNEGSIRVWAPSGGSGTGSVIEVNGGWGDPEDSSLHQHSSSARVHVLAWLDAAPAYDSGWFELRSQDGASSFREVSHGLGSHPWRVKVYVRATSGSSSGYVWPAGGSDLGDDDNAHGMTYGGVVFAYSEDRVRLWAPTQNNNAAEGRVVSVGPGWAGGHMEARLSSASVKVLAWPGADPDFDSGWFDMSVNLLNFRELDHGLGSLPERVKVYVRPADGPNAGFWFEASGAQLTDGASHTDVGAVTFAYSDTSVRVWAPNTKTCAACVGLCGVTDGWGGGVNGGTQPVAAVRVVAWAVYHGLTDAATISVAVEDVEEGPAMEPLTVSITEKPPAGTPVFSVGATDDDGDPLSFSIVGGDPDGVWAVSGAGELVPVDSRAIDFWAAPTWVLSVKAEDPTGLSAVVDFTVNLEDVNDEPEVEPAFTFSMREGAADNDDVGIPLGATDLDRGQSLTYSILSGNVDDAFKISACAGQLSVHDATAIDFEKAQSYTLEVLVADDGTPPMAANTTVTINIENLNDVPTMPPAAIDVPETAQVGDDVGPALLGTVTDEDPDDSHSFRIVAGGTHTSIDAATGQLRLTAPVDFESQPQLDLVVEVADDGSPSQASTATVTIAVIDANDAPAWRQAVALAVPENSPPGTTFGGPVADKVVDEDDGQALTFSITGGDTTPPTFAIDGDSGQFSVLRSDTLDHEGPAATMLIEVTVSDDGVPFGNPLATPTVVTVTITNVNEAPSIATQAVSIPENVDAGTATTPALVASDPDDDDLTWAIIAGNDDGVLAIDAATGALTLAPGAFLNHEATDTLTVTVSVSDGDGMDPLTDAATVTVSVADVPEAPVLAAAMVAVVENSLAGTPIHDLSEFLEDPDVGDTHTWTLVDGPPSVALGSASGVLSVVTPLNHEAHAQHALVVRVEDGAGLTALQSFTLTVTDANDDPVFSRASDSFAVPENSGGEVVFGTPLSAFSSDEDRPMQPLTFSIITGDPTSQFDVDAVTGQLGVADGAALDAEATASFTIVVAVTDPIGGQATMIVDVEVVDANDPPENFVGFGEASIPEAAVSPLAVGTPVFAEDPDDHTVSYSIVSGDMGDFVIGAASGQVTVSPSAALDHESKPVYTLTLAATDDADRPLFTTTSVVVRVLDVPEAPTLSPATFTIDENSPPGTFVGTVLGADEDDGQTAALVYSLAGAGFTVSPSSGDITVADDGTALDFETAAVHTTTLTVTDTTQRTATATITVNLADVNEAPAVVAPPEASVDEGAASGTPLSASLSDFVVDADAGDSVTFEATGGSAAGVLTVSPSGGLSVAVGAVLDYEAQPVFELEWRAVDASGAETVGTLAFTLNDVNDLVLEGIQVVDVAGVGRGTLIRTSGNEFVQLTGANFGPVSGTPAPTIAATYGPSGTEYATTDCSVVRGNVEILCTAVPGVGTNHVWHLTVNGNTVTSGAMRTSYEPPAVQHGHHDDSISTKGGDTVLIHLDNGGPAGMPVMATYGETGVEYTAENCYMSDDYVNVNCTTVEGSGGNLRWIVHVAGQDSELGPPMTSYAAPLVTDINIAALPEDASHAGGDSFNHTHTHSHRVLSAGHDPHDDHFTHTHRVATYGGQKVQLIGENFGPPPDVGYLQGLNVELGQGGGWVWTGVGPAAGKRRLDIGHGSDDDGADDDGVFVPGGVVPHGGSALAHYRGLLVTFGPQGTEFLAKDCVMTVPHTELECTAPAAVGYHHTWVVRVNYRVGPASALHTHCAVPVVHTVTGPGAQLASTKGGQQVVLSGAHFGLAAYVHEGLYSATYGPTGTEYTATDCKVTEDHVRMQCLTAPGVGSGHSWMINVAGQESALVPANTGYAAPTVSHFTAESSPSLLPHETAGGDAVVIHGHNFGASEATLDWVRYGPLLGDGTLSNSSSFSAASCVMVAPHEALRCVTAPGAGANLGWVVSVASQPSVTASTGYAAPQVTSVVGGVAVSTGGGATFTIEGTNFGDADFLDGVFFGASGSAKYTADCVHTVPHTELECVMPAGVGQGLQVQVWVGGQASSLEDDLVVGYAAPTVTDMDVTSGPTSGGVTVTISGDNWGVEDPTATRFVTFDGVVVPHEDGPHTGPGTHTASFVLPEGVGTGHTVSLGVGVVEAPEAPPTPATVTETFSYNPPVVDVMHTNEHPSVDGEPAVLLVIKGADFGSGSVAEGGQVLVDGTAVPADRVQLYSHTRIEVILLLSGFGGDLRGSVVVAVGGQASPPKSFEHFSPQVLSAIVSDGEASEVSSNAFNTEGGSTLTLLGTYFGEESQLSVTVGGRPCTDLTLTTHPLPEPSVISCTVPPGEGKQRPVIVSRGGQLSDGAPLNYQSPTVSSFAPYGRDGEGAAAPATVASASTAGSTVTVSGANWGTTTPFAFMGGSRLGVTRVSHLEFQVEVPPGMGANHALQLGVSWPSSLPAGAVHVGGCLAVCPESATCWDNGATCVELMDALVLTYKAPVIGAVVSAEGGSVAHDHTHDGDSGPTNDDDGHDHSGHDHSGHTHRRLHAGAPAGSTAGGFDVVLHGSDFGAMGLGTATALVCDSANVCAPCPIVSHNHTMVVCEAPPGQGSDLRVVLTADGQSSAGNPDDASEGVGAAFSYAPPVITSMSTHWVASEGANNVTLYGHNFGVEDASLAVSTPENELEDGHPLLAHRRVVLESWDAGLPAMQAATVVERSHTHLSVLVPPGQGPRNLLWVEVGGQPSPSGMPLGYLPPVLDRVDVDASCCNTDGGYSVTVVGSSLGVDRRVWVSKHTERNLTLGADGQPANWRACALEATTGGLSPHTAASCVVPPGIGAGLSIGVFSGLGAPAVACGGLTPGGQPTDPICGPALNPDVSNLLPFSYDPPELTIMNPSPADANGGVLKFLGKNFGAAVLDEVSAVNVTIDGLPCRGPEFIRPSAGSAFLTCVADPMPVGYKNLTLTVAAQTQRVYADAALNFAAGNLLQFAAFCEKGLFGRTGEACTVCPRGGLCEACDVPAFNVTAEDGGTDVSCAVPEHNDVYAVSGWWLALLPTEVGGSVEDLCAPAHVGGTREYCPRPIPCDPPEACLGNNTCSAAYTGYRCAECAERHYRLGGECIPCPDNAWLIIVVFVVVAVLACVLGYVLSSKHVNMAFVAIGVDYLQVLALFSRSKVQWPPVLESMFAYLGAFNLDLSLTAPECTIPDLAYTTKWAFTMLMPFAATALCALIYVVVYIKKKFILRRTARLHSHLPLLIGLILIIWYYMYLVLARSTLDVFNCSPTDPPDGKEYLEVVFEECGLSGGVQMTLMPYAIVSLLGFCLGFPVFLAYLLLKNKRTIWADQILRCHGLGDKRRTSTNKTYLFRKMYGKLYYHFVPQRWYWKVVIIARKAAIAFVSLLFRRNVTFQLAILLLVLFVSYALQLKFVPYMSPADMPTSLKLHDELAKAGDTFRATVNSDISNTLAEAKRSRIRARNAAWQPSSNFHVRRVANFVVSMNVVESTLLFAACLVALGGILFESGQLDASNYQVQRDFVSAALLIVIFGSLSYYIAVVVLEVKMSLESRRKDKRPVMDRKNSAKALKERAAPPRRTSVAFTAGLSPMFSADAAEGAEAVANATPAAHMSKSDIEVLRAGYKALQEENATLKHQLEEAEATTARRGALGAYRKSTRTVRSKKSFRPQVATDMNTTTVDNPMLNVAPREPRADDAV